MTMVPAFRVPPAGRSWDRDGTRRTGRPGHPEGVVNGLAAHQSYFPVKESLSQDWTIVPPVVNDVAAMTSQGRSPGG